MSEEHNSQVNLSKIQEDLEKSNPALFKGLDPGKKKQVAATIVHYSKSHSGPLPSPDTLSEYNTVLPDAANRIFTEFESQGQHRRKQENRAIAGQVNQSYIGQIFAFIIALAFLGSAVWVITEGYEFAGSVIGVADLAGLVTVFIKGKYYQKQNLESKKI